LGHAIEVASFGICGAFERDVLAQSLPNYGPNAPAPGDSFGEPPSGTND
jgi:hypothetical protein